MLLLDLFLFLLVVFLTCFPISDAEWMDAPVLSRTKAVPVKSYEQLAELRAQRHEHMRWRNNVTSCRSPTRESDTNLIKDEMKKKRHQEFLKRRSVTLEPCGSSPPAETFSPNRPNVPNAPAGKGHRVMIVPLSSTLQGPSSHRQVTKRMRNAVP